MTEMQDIEEVSRIMELRGQGLSAETIGKRLYMNASTVRKKVQKAGLSEQFRGVSARDKLERNQDTIREMLESGATYAEICERFGVVKSTVRLWRKALGIPPRKLGGGNSLHLDTDELARLWDEGKNFSEIGRIVGATGCTVRLNMVRAGIVGATGNIRNQKFPTDPEEIRKLRELLSGELKNDEIAAMLGIGSSTVSGWRRKLGISDMGSGRRRRW